MTKGKTIIKGALILTAANLITRIMGFVYRIYMSKVLGTHGMGVYQLIIPVYLLVFSLCSSGLATAVSTCTAANHAKNDMGAVRRILHCAVVITFFLSLAASGIVFFGSGFIGKTVLHERQTVLSLKIISFCFPFMCVGSCLRGYFYGRQKMTVPAVSQLIEQAVRIAAVYFLCDKMLSRGLGYACAAAVMGMAGGETVSFLFTVAAYYLRHSELEKTTSLSHFAAFKTVVSLSLPLTLNRGVSACLSTAENILIPQRIALCGMTSEQALGLFGGLCGMAIPLIMFPCSLLTAFATALMPAISEYSAAKDHAAIRRALKRTLLFTTAVGICVSGFFIAFPNEIARSVYGREDISAMLRILGMICPFLYTQVILSAALNGINCQLYIFKLGILSSAITISAIIFLIPHYGIHAYIAGWAAAIIITNTLSRTKLESISGSFGIGLTDILKCLLAAVFACFIGKRFCGHFQINGLVSLLLLSGIFGLGYLLLLDVLGATEMIFPIKKP